MPTIIDDALHSNPKLDDTINLVPAPGGIGFRVERVDQTYQDPTYGPRAFSAEWAIQYRVSYFLRSGEAGANARAEAAADSDDEEDEPSYRCGFIQNNRCNLAVDRVSATAVATTSTSTTNGAWVLDPDTDPGGRVPWFHRTKAISVPGEEGERLMQMVDRPGGNAPVGDRIAAVRGFDEFEWWLVAVRSERAQNMQIADLTILARGAIRVDWTARTLVHGGFGSFRPRTITAPIAPVVIPPPRLDPLKRF